MKSLHSFLTEGAEDPAIFKAVFLAGGPGSGKSFIVGKTYKITTLTGTSQGQWNTTAGTVSVTYAVGDTFIAATAGAGSGLNTGRNSLTTGASTASGARKSLGLTCTKSSLRKYSKPNNLKI